MRRFKGEGPERRKTGNDGGEDCKKLWRVVSKSENEPAAEGKGVAEKNRILRLTGKNRVEVCNTALFKKLATSLNAERNLRFRVNFKDGSWVNASTLF